MTFAKPFTLDGVDGVWPAGAYCVETDEERLEGISFPAYRRVTTLIYRQPRPGRRGPAWTLTVDPDELDAALARDTRDESPVRS